MTETISLELAKEIARAIKLGLSIQFRSSGFGSSVAITVTKRICEKTIQQCVNVNQEEIEYSKVDVLANWLNIMIGHIQEDDPCKNT